VLAGRNDTVAPNVAEAVGVVSVAQLNQLVASDASATRLPLSGQVTESLAAVGVGETAATALTRIKPGQAAVWVLVDGRVTGFITRDELMREVGH
jgi:predicted transcriptional regulator